MTRFPHLSKKDQLTEHEWLIANEPNRELRLMHIKEYNDIYEEIHGPGSFERSGESPVREVRPDLRSTSN